MGTKRLRRRVRRALDWLAAANIDLRLRLTGQSDPELPPPRLRFLGTVVFRALGDALKHP